MQGETKWVVEGRGMGDFGYKGPVGTSHYLPWVEIALVIFSSFLYGRLFMRMLFFVRIAVRIHH